MSLFEGLYGHPHWNLIVQWFDPTGYLDLHEDLQTAGYRIQDPEPLIYHFVNQGFLERRIYRPQLVRHFDFDFYRRQLGVSGKGLTNYELMQHWVYDGIFRGLSPSEATEAALSSPFQVFNMGRVGSQSVVQALLAAGATNVIHTHSEYEFRINYLGAVTTFSQLIQIKHLSAKVPSPRFISGVRDPMSWALSAVGRSARVGDQALPSDSQSLLSRVRLVLGSALNWFAHNYFIGLNVFEHQFDQELGWAFVDHGRSRLLLYRLDRLPQLGPALKEFTGVAELHLPRVDVSSGSDEQRRLEGWLRDAAIPEELLREVYDSDFARHFFTPAERTDQLDRWLARAS